MQQSSSSLLRKQFRVQIRRKQVDSMLKKKRYEMILQNYISGECKVNDDDKIRLVLQLIKQYPTRHLIDIVIPLIQLDHSLQLFRELTNYSINQMPMAFKHIINNTLGIDLDNIIFQQDQIPKPYKKIYIFQQEITSIFYSLANWWTYQQNKTYYNILILIKQIQNQANLIHPDIIQFVSFVTNILLIAQRISKAFCLEVKTAVGDHPMEIQLQISQRLLLNILGVQKDEQLCVVLPEFLKLNGRAIEMIEIYHNLFLIKHVQHQLRLIMVCNFIQLLEFNPEEMLQNHESYIFLFYLCLKTNNIPVNKPQFTSFQQFCIKMINVIGNLLKAIAFKLNDGLSQNNMKLKEHLSYILNQLANIKKQQSLLKIMNYQSITQFMCSNLKYAKLPDEQLIITNIFNIYNNIAISHHSTQFFAYQSPKVYAMLLSLLNKYQSVQLYEISELQYDRVLKKLVLLVLNLCATDHFAARFIQQNIFLKLSVIYNRLMANTTSIYIKLYIEELYTNLLIHIKNSSEAYFNSNIIFNLFNHLQSRSVMLEMLKYKQNDKAKTKIVQFCLKFWIYVVDQVQNFQQSDELYKLLRDSSVLSRLAELQCCQNIYIQCCAKYLIKQLQQNDNIKYVAVNHEQDEVEQYQLANNYVDKIE